MLITPCTCGGVWGVWGWVGVSLIWFIKCSKAGQGINRSNDTVPSYYLHCLIWRCWLALGTDCGYACVCHCSSTRSSLNWRRNCCAHVLMCLFGCQVLSPDVHALTFFHWLTCRCKPGLFFQVDLCSVCFKDALWCVHPNREVLHDARTLLQVLRHLRLLSRSVLWTWWDRHTHAKHAALALDPVTPFNWIPPLYGRPLATTFDLYSPLTPASPYHRWLRQILFVLWNLC